MSAKRFLFYRVAISMIIAGVVSSSIVIGNYILPIVTIITALIFLYIIKKKVSEVLEDERDYEIAGKAARYTLSIFSAITGIIVIILFSLRQKYQGFELAGSILAYAICSLLLIYSIIFKYYQSVKNQDYKYLYLVFLLLIIIIFAVFGLRLFSGEDSWICQDGQWIKHGHPSASMPDKPCLK